MRIIIVSILGLSVTAALASPVHKPFEGKRSPADEPLFAGDALSDIIQNTPDDRPQTNQLSSTTNMDMPGWVETVAKVVAQSDKVGGRLGAGGDLGGMSGFRPNGVARPVKRSEHQGYHGADKAGEYGAGLRRRNQHEEDGEYGAGLR